MNTKQKRILTLEGSSVPVAALRKWESLSLDVQVYLTHVARAYWMTHQDARGVVMKLAAVLHTAAVHYGLTDNEVCLITCRVADADKVLKEGE